MFQPDKKVSMTIDGQGLVTALSLGRSCITIRREQSNQGRNIIAECSNFVLQPSESCLISFFLNSLMIEYEVDSVA